MTQALAIRPSHILAERMERMKPGEIIKPRDTEPVFLQGVQIRWRNFEGRESAYNAAGKRNFVIELDDDKAVELFEAGWNVKLSKPTDEGVQNAFLPVEVNYAGRGTPPEVILVGAKNKAALLPEDLVHMADGVEIAHCNIYIRPYDWKMNRNSGRKAYLKTIAIVMRPNPVLAMYGELEDASAVQQPALESGDQTPPADDSYEGELLPPLVSGTEPEPDYPDADIIGD